jgi:DNA-directed RNA polymerase specialized sigma24 family protein
MELLAEHPPVMNPDRLFEALYEKAFPPVAKFVAGMNGSFDDAKDIFQDALVIYYEKRTRPDFQINGPPEAYILGIAKHLWLRKFKADIKNSSLDRFEKEIKISDEDLPAINSDKLLKLLETTGKKCMDLLRAFYYEKLPVREIRQVFNYATEHSATVQKYKCIEKVRAVVQSKSASYEDFTE